MKRNFIAILAGSLVVIAPMLANLAVAQTPTASFGAPNAERIQAQRAQSEQKRNQIRSQLEQIVTPEQRQQFLAVIEQGQSMQVAIAAMNLSATQKAQLQQVMATAGLPNLSKLNLTQEQKAQLEQVSVQVRTQLDQILTAEQRQQFKTALVQGGGLKEAIASINLSAEQKTQLRQVIQSNRLQLNSILTADQKQQLRRSLTSLRQQHQR